MRFLQAKFREKVSVDEGRCRGCGSCIEVCARGVFEYGEESSAEFPTVKAAHEDRCVLCALCAALCPAKAITLRK